MLSRLYRISASIVVALAATLFPAVADARQATDFAWPWLRHDRAIVIDAYEYNEIDWPALSGDKRIVGFISKASDGLPPVYRCTGDDVGLKLCKTLWRRHAVARELFHTRRTLARAIGLKWGAYHLGRPGNPIDQANNFIDFAEPGPDDLVAIDIEENNPDEWMSLEDAEEFARHIKRRIGRFPVLYTNGATAQFIADNRETYPLLSRLQLWYARYKPEIGTHFPKGNWRTYALWQFSAQANCDDSACPYRVPGAGNDIDVNVAALTPNELRAAWPFGSLVDGNADLLGSVPIPISRSAALAGKVELVFAAVSPTEPIGTLAAAFRAAGERYPAKVHPLAVAYSPLRQLYEVAARQRTLVAAYAPGTDRRSRAIDATITASTAFDQPGR